MCCRGCFHIFSSDERNAVTGGVSLTRPCCVDDVAPPSRRAGLDTAAQHPQQHPTPHTTPLHPVRTASRGCVRAETRRTDRHGRWVFVLVWTGLRGLKWSVWTGLCVHCFRSHLWVCSAVFSLINQKVFTSSCLWTNQRSPPAASLFTVQTVLEIYIKSQFINVHHVYGKVIQWEPSGKENTINIK